MLKNLLKRVPDGTFSVTFRYINYNYFMQTYHSNKI